jgi:lysophospholipase L1-like esterase
MRVTRLNPMLFKLAFGFFCLAAVALADSAKVRILLVGDSTVTDVAGWAPGFKAALLPVAECINESASGRSSKSYRDDGHWAKALAIKADYMLIQFGHNDVAGKGPTRETIPGSTYRDNMARFVDEARAHGMRPVLVTSIAHRDFGPDGKLKADGVEPYVAVVRELARQKNVPVIDLYADTRDLCARLGPEGSAKLGRLIPDPKGGQKLDTTHLGPVGAREIGQLAARDLVHAVPELASDFQLVSTQP